MRKTRVDGRHASPPSRPASRRSRTTRRALVGYTVYCGHCRCTTKWRAGGSSDAPRSLRLTALRLLCAAATCAHHLGKLGGFVDKDDEGVGELVVPPLTPSVHSDPGESQEQRDRGED